MRVNLHLQEKTWSDPLEQLKIDHQKKIATNLHISLSNTNTWVVKVDALKGQ